MRRFDNYDLVGMIFHIGR